MKRVALLGVLCTLAIGTAAVGATAAPASAQTTPVVVPVAGTATNALGQVVNFAGQFTLQSFQFANGQLSAVGQLTGTLTNTVTGVTQTVSQLVTLPIGQVTAQPCQILHLEIGPIDLNLLGLVVHTNRIVIDITAVPGAGNLLGNLLCAVAHLLDSNASGNALANMLNHLLGSL
jgi:hypothetical protein